MGNLKGAPLFLRPSVVRALVSDVNLIARAITPVPVAPVKLVDRPRASEDPRLATANDDIASFERDPVEQSGQESMLEGGEASVGLDVLEASPPTDCANDWPDVPGMEADEDPVIVAIHADEKPPLPVIEAAAKKLRTVARAAVHKGGGMAEQTAAAAQFVSHHVGLSDPIARRPTIKSPEARNRADVERRGKATRLETIRSIARKLNAQKASERL